MFPIFKKKKKKEPDQQNLRKATYRMGENICKAYTQ